MFENFVIDKNNNFINPYAFISLSDTSKCTRAPKEDGNLTGKITCKITPKTDIFIPNTSSNKAFDTNVNEHKCYDFFSYINLNGKASKGFPENPVIPGSEIRGVIRNAYETLTNSCLSSLDNIQLTSRLNKPKKPGLVYKTDSGYELRPTTKGRIILNSRNYNTGDSYEGKAHTFNNSDRKVEQKNIKGFILKGEKPVKPVESGGISKNISVFKEVKSTTPASIKISTTELKLLETQVKEFYASSAINKNLKSGHTGYKGYCESIKNLKNGDIEALPVYYYNVDGKIYLSPACIGRTSYHKTLQDLAKDYAPCNKAELCPACSLFGTINKAMSATSKIRFTDAHANRTATESDFKEPCEMKILGTPNTSSVEFYTHLSKYLPEKPSYWTYDFMIIGKNNLVKYKNENDLSINGRKFYWHHQVPSYTSDEGKNGMNTTIRPLNAESGLTFSFDVYFDKITESQLQKIIATLSCCDNNNENCYKIGTGKPIGLGSIKVTVEDIEICTLNRNTYTYDFEKANEYNEYCDGTKKITDVFGSSKPIREFEKITNFKAINKDIKISYPIAINKDDDNQIFQWFVQNRMNGTMNNNSNMRTLPPIIDDNNNDNDISLPSYKSKDENSNSYQNNNRPNSNRSNNYSNNPKVETTCVECGRKIFVSKFIADQGIAKCYNCRNKQKGNNNKRW